MKLNRESATPYLTTDPPHWAARGLSYSLIAIFISAVAGAILIEAPETVTAEFVLAPRLGADPVRAMRGGIIQQVNLVEGRTVSKGDTLFIIRSEQTGDQSADLRTSEAQLKGAGESLILAAEKYRNQQLAPSSDCTSRPARPWWRKGRCSANCHVPGNACRPRSGFHR